MTSTVSHRLAGASGVDLEELGTDALLIYFGVGPMNQIRHRYIRQIMIKLNLKGFLQ